MTQTKHTPGPWTIDFETDQLEAQRSVLGMVYGASFKDEFPDHECVANAKLIAAAPELLEALQNTWNKLNLGNPLKHEDMELIQRSITKATV